MNSAVRERKPPLPAFLALAVMLLLGLDAASAACVDDWLTVEEVDEAGAVGLRVANNQEFPITYSLRIRTNAYTGGRHRTLTGSLQGYETARIPSSLPRLDRASGGDLKLSCSWTIGDREAVHDDRHLYRLPYADGTSYRVLQGFGARFSHRGIEEFAVDFKMREGTAVHAARAGVVAQVVESNDKGCWEDGCGEYANFIVILHSDGTTGEYYHLQQSGALVEVGEEVLAGQKIGLSGNTGHTALPHLHFAVYRATNRGRSQSVPISFISADGIVSKPRSGHHYLAVARRQNGD